MRWLLPLIVAGCYAPSVQPGSPCSTDGSCPTGLVCSPASGTCELTAVDAAIARDVPLADVPIVHDATTDAAVDAMIDAAPMPPSPSVLVQQITNQNTSGPGITATFAAVPVAGHLLVMVGANPSRLIDTVTGGATWQLIVRSNVNINAEIWMGIATGGSAVAFSTTDGDAPNSIWLGEFTHATTTIDVPGTHTSGATSPATVPVLTTADDDLAIFAVGDGISNTFGTVTNWTAGTALTAGPITQGVWYRNLGPNAVEAPTVTETSHNWDAALAVVKRQ